MILSLCLGSLSVGAQVKEFVVEGHVNLPDGYSVSICCHTDTEAVSVAEGKIIDGKFLLKGEMEQGQPGTLMTNNLELVEKHHWPTDSIHWTYTDIFLSPGKIKVDENGDYEWTVDIDKNLIELIFEYYAKGGSKLDNPSPVYLLAFDFM